MKQNMKRAFLVLCMAVCVFALSACSKKDDVLSEPIPDAIANTMESGAEDYLEQFVGYDDETLASDMKRVEKQKNTVMIAALNSWKGIKGDLGEPALNGNNSAILSKNLERVSEDSYKITVRVSFEKRALTFTLTAQEVEGNSGITLMPTELLFTPDYKTGEKLSKAGKNTLMGMGTVFAVLILISFIISALKGVNTLEANMRAKKEAKENENSMAASVSANPVPVAPVVAETPVPNPVPEPVLEAAPAYAEMVETEDNLVDDRELVAVITAAIAAATSVPAEGLVVRSIRRSSASKWKKA